MGKILRRSENTSGVLPHPFASLSPFSSGFGFGFCFWFFSVVFSSISLYFRGGGVAQNLVESSSCGCSLAWLHSVSCPMPSFPPKRNLGGRRGHPDRARRKPQVRGEPAPSAGRGWDGHGHPPAFFCRDSGYLFPGWDARGGGRRTKSSKRLGRAVQMIRSGQV